MLASPSYMAMTGRAGYILARLRVLQMMYRCLLQSSTCRSAHGRRVHRVSHAKPPPPARRPRGGPPLRAASARPLAAATWLETAAHLADHVIPPVPVRQWVISVPKRLLCAAAGVTSDAATPASARPRLGGISLILRTASLRVRATLSEPRCRRPDQSHPLRAPPTQGGQLGRAGSRPQGHDKAARPPDAERLRAQARKPPPRREKAGGLRKPWCAPGRQEHATHEPLISRAMLAEVPLTGLSMTARGTGITSSITGTAETYAGGGSGLR